jgi:glyoxylase-like metal-dependent hydrolase (beta-lactamase superfamily II)
LDQPLHPIPSTIETALTFPFPKPPEPGRIAEIRPGILWARVPLPFRLNHVNVYIIDDGDGWAIFDTGIDDATTRNVWEEMIAGPLYGRRITRLIVSHFHPDHIGLAGALTERFDVPLATTQTSYLMCLNMSLSPGSLDTQFYRDFYLRHGLDAQATQVVCTRGHDYLRMVSPLPQTFSRLAAGDTIALGGRSFSVLCGEGHAPEQLMLYCAEEKLFLVADQVIAKISPNVSVWAVDPDGDPLGLYLRSLASLKTEIDANSLVLPGHQLPFYGLASRATELIEHHERRCHAIAEACRIAPKSAAELIPVLFSHRSLDPHQMSFAFSEILAHVNFMLRQGAASWLDQNADVLRLIT